MKTPKKKNIIIISATEDDERKSVFISKINTVTYLCDTAGLSQTTLKYHLYITDIFLLFIAGTERQNTFFFIFLSVTNPNDGVINMGKGQEKCVYLIIDCALGQQRVSGLWNCGICSASFRNFKQMILLKLTNVCNKLLK